MAKLNGNEIITNEKEKSVGQYVVSYQKAGYGGVIPVINGEPHQELMMGFVSESDRDAGLKMLTKALEATDGNIPAAMAYMYNAVLTAAKEIKPDDVADVDGYEILISYEERKAYYNNTEIANLDDISCELPNEAIKAMLVDRSRNAIADECDYDCANCGADCSFNW